MAHRRTRFEVSLSFSVQTRRRPRAYARGVGCVVASLLLTSCQSSASDGVGGPLSGGTGGGAGTTSGGSGGAAGSKSGGSGGTAGGKSGGSGGAAGGKSGGAGGAAGTGGTGGSAGSQSGAGGCPASATPTMPAYSFGKVPFPTVPLPSPSLVPTDDTFFDLSAAPLSEKQVFAHYMVCCSFKGLNDDFAAAQQDIIMAQKMGINGFALNAGAWLNASDGPAYQAHVDAMFKAAAALGSGFVLFFSADMTGLGYADILAMMTKYASHPSYFRYQGRGLGGATLFRDRRAIARERPRADSSRLPRTRGVGYVYSRGEFRFFRPDRG